MIFNPPETKNGTLCHAAWANRGPVKIGAREAPVVLATPVIPAAAERSSGRTMAIVYDCRVGTSICEILKRSRRTAMARGRLGMSGTRMSRMFEGMWVNTIVRMSPILEATRAAAKAERPARILAPKKMPPSNAGWTPNLT